MTPIGEVWTFAIGEPATVDTVADALYNSGVEGATIIPATGFWQGHREQSTVVQIAGISFKRAQEIADRLRRVFDQQAIYVESRGEAWLETGESAYTLAA